MGTREAQKTIRRDAILEAARTLIQEGKGDDFSMPELAQRAGVSLVTPYNLFGSKSGILLEIAREDIFERAQEIGQLPCADLPEWTGSLSSVLARVYWRNRHFYRRMIVTLTARESASGQREVLALTYGMFAPSLARLQQRGLLTNAVPAEILAQHLAHSVSGAMQHRLMERGSEEALRQEIEAGIVLTLLGLCGDADRAELRGRLEALAEGSEARLPGKL
jgi:AcrR family transcriptional regulator